MRNDFLFVATIMIIIIVISGAILIYQWTLPVVNCEIQTAEITVANIKSMELGNETSGKGTAVFGIGYGFIGEHPYYYVYKETGTDQYLLEKLDAQKVYLVENNSQPRIVYQYKYFVVKGKSKAINIDGVKYKPDMLSMYEVNGETYAIVKNNTDNPEYKPLAEKLSLKPEETLYVSSLSPQIKLYVPKDTVKVKYETDIN